MAFGLKAMQLCGSAIGLALAATPAQAQQAANSTDPSLKQDAPTNPASVVPPTTLPRNSDAAEDQQVQDQVERKGAATGTVDLAQAAERARIQAIHDLRRKDALTAKPQPDDGTITVTGSRLKSGDVASRLIVIDAQDIQARGVTSVEELIRTLPQNVATVGAITNSRSHGPLRDGNRSTISAVGALGVSAANLGGIGAGNTLILINGRRIAGAAGIEQGYANLNGIPLAAIERVEIGTEGASAVYGADALGGVINFILKNNYVGTTLSAQHLFSSGGADTTRVNGYTGYAWGSGNVSATIDYTRRNPIENRRTGYTTNNYAPRFGGKSDYDYRSFDAGQQPGVIDVPATYDPDTGELATPDTALTVTKGFTGRPTKADLITIGRDNSRDYVPRYAGPFSRSISGTLQVAQNVTDKLRLFANGLYTRTKNSQQSLANNGISVLLGPGQYYNPFGVYEVNAFSVGTEVKYYPGTELADGTLPSGTVSNTANSWNVDAGFSYDFNRQTKIEFVYTRSRSSTSGDSLDLNALVNDYVEDAASPTGYSCVNNLLQQNAVPMARLAAFKVAFDRQCQALTSSDPTKAFNPFKSTTNGGGTSIADFLAYPATADLSSTLQNFEARLSGSVFKLPAGEINYAVGGEYAKTGVSSEEIQAITGGSGASSRYALFAEMNVPLIGKDFTLPLIRRLSLNLALRRDITTTRGAVGTVDGVPIDKGGQLIYAENRFGRTTPAYGMLWSPFNNLDLRAKFTTGFKAPPPTQLFTTLGTYNSITYITGDPLYTCTSDCRDDTTDSYVVPSRVAPNPDLKPETSRQMVLGATWRPSGTLTGLNLALTYNRNRIRNQFARLQDLAVFLPQSEIYKLAQFYPRDSNGKIIQQNSMRFNVIGSNYESLTYEASYLFDTHYGSFQPKLTVVQNITAESIGLDRAFVLSQRGRILGVDKYRLVGSVQWNKGPITANLFVYHTPSYLNDYLAYRNAGRVSNEDLITTVAPLTTVDLSVSWLASKNLNFQFAGRNILKAGAPFTVVDNLPYDTARYDVAGRTFSLTAQVTF